MYSDYQYLSKYELERERNTELKFIARFDGDTLYEDEVEDSYERLSILDELLESY